MFEFEIIEGASITLEYGQQILATPRLLIGDLNVLLTIRNSVYELDKEVAYAIGSNEDWLHMTTADTLGFDAETHLLKVISFRYPEHNKVPANLSLLKEAEKIAGLPRLVKYPESFQLERFPYRYYHIDGNVLLCFGDAFTLADRITEVFVSNDFSLFFSNNRYCGWGLYHPETFMVNRIAEENEYPSDSFLKESLRDAFDLITNETVDKMDEHDDDCLQQIALLHNRIAAHGATPDSPLSVLENWLFEVADNFYKEEQVSRLFVKKS
jgi:hypothetical protein